MLPPLLLLWLPFFFQENRAEEALIRRLSDNSASAATRIEALEELSMRVGELPYEAVNSVEKVVRGIWQIDYARCLARCGPQAVPDLRQLLNKHNPLIQAEAVYGIVLHDKLHGESFALRILRDIRKPQAARMAALRGLSERGSALAKPEALRKLETGSGGVLLEALAYMRKNPMLEDIPYLVDVLDGHDGRPAAEAASLLQSITGYRAGDDPRTWRFFMVKHKVEGTPFRRDSAEDEGAVPTLSYMGIPILSNRVVFVLDASGSMDSPLAERDGETRGQRAVEELISLLPRLPEDAKFSIIFFDSLIDSFSGSMVHSSRKNISEATSWLKRRQFKSGTNIFGGLSAAFDVSDVEEIVLLSDGEPSVGEVQDMMKIRSWVKRWNRWRLIRLSTVSLSAPRGAREFLARLADDNDGSCRDIR